MVTNRLDNAIEYAPGGGKVTVRLRGEDDRIPLEVFRASNARTISEIGTGLGFAIVKPNVEQCGGSVGIESVE